MPLNITAKPKQTHKEILLPSGGYPYKGVIPGGRLMVKAFDFEAEKMLFKGIEATTGKEMLKFVEAVKRVAQLPKELDAMDLLEGDVQYIILEARSLSYGSHYKFDSSCAACRHVETADFVIPDHLPINRYPNDFPGTIKINTVEGNDVEIKFLTAREDIAAENYTRKLIAQKVVSQGDFEDDYALSKLAKHIVSLNGGTADMLEETRGWIRSIPVTEKSQITRFINEVAPGVSYKVEMVCEKCGENYQTMMPITANFFRAGDSGDRTELPRGVRIGVFGKDERSEVSLSAGAEILPGGGVSGGGGKGASAIGGGESKKK